MYFCYVNLAILLRYTNFRLYLKFVLSFPLVMLATIPQKSFQKYIHNCLEKLTDDFNYDTKQLISLINQTGKVAQNVISCFALHLTI